MKKVVIVGGTGYIGKYVVKESVKRGYDTTVVIRPGGEPKADYFAGAKLVYADVCDQDSIKSVISEPVDAVVSCLASSNICTRTPLPFLSLPPSPPPTQTHECTFVHTLAHTFAHLSIHMHMCTHTYIITCKFSCSSPRTLSCTHSLYLFMFYFQDLELRMIRTRLITKQL